MKTITVTTRTSACLLMLSFAQCQADLADEETGTMDQAVLHDQEGNLPTCEEDDGCKFDCATPDPDCPSDPPDTHGSPSTTWALTGAVTPTGISGFAGSDTYTLGVANSSVNAVYAILSNERNNIPCLVAIGTENVNDATIDSAPTKDLCGPNGSTSSTMHADYLDINAGGSDDHMFVSAVIVCMNADRDRVKGIGVLGKKLTASGTLASVGEVSDDRANCDGRWESWEYCPVGQIATAVDLHFASGNTPRSLVGVALQCRAVTP